MSHTRLRVLHVISSFDGGGAERVLLTLLCRLGGVSQHLAIAGSGTLLPLVPPTVPVHAARTEFELADLMVRLRPDVVHTWLDNSLLMTIAPAAHLGIPLVHRLYNVPSIQKVYEPGGPGHNELMARALGAATKVVSLSGTAADDAVVFYGIPRPEVIVNGFPLAGDRGTGQTRFEKPAGRFVILNVARLAPQKGHAHLIDAFALLAPAHPDVDLWIAGIGALEADLRARARAAGVADRVRFLGFQEDVTALHRVADLFVFPSVFEGFGNALGEALLAGLPIVATDLPVVRHDVLGDTASALLVPVGDVRALADALARLIANEAEREALGRRARVRGSRFGVDRMLSAYNRVYAGLAESVHAVA